LHSLGVRPQAVPLRFVTHELKPHLFLSHQPFKTVFSWIEKKLLSVERMSVTNLKPNHVSREKVYHRAYIGETTSLIYLPVFIRGNALYDAITKNRVASIPDKEAGTLSFQKLRAGQISFIPTLCPRCGWDLQGEKDSLVLLCRNCDTAWKASGNGLENLDFAVFSGEKDSPLYLPFWRMKVRITGVSLKVVCRPGQVCKPAEGDTESLGGAGDPFLVTCLQDPARALPEDGKGCHQCPVSGWGRTQGAEGKSLPRNPAC